MPPIGRRWRPGRAAGARSRALRPLHGPSAARDRLERADRQARRPAADGELAAARHLYRRPGARRRRHQGRRGALRDDGHDRGGRRRRARRGCRRRHPRRLARPATTATCCSTRSSRPSCARRCSWPSSPTCSPATSRSSTRSPARRAPSWARKAPALPPSRRPPRASAPASRRHALVGGAFQAEHSDMLLTYELGGYLHRGAWHPLWERAGTDGGGVITGSGAAFLVLESREHAGRPRRAGLRGDRAVAIGRNRAGAGRAGLPDAIAALIARRRAAPRPLLTSRAPPAPRGDRRRAAQRSTPPGRWRPRLRLAHRPHQGGAVPVRHRACRAGHSRTRQAYPPFDCRRPKPPLQATSRPCWRPRSAIIASKALPSSLRHEDVMTTPIARPSRPADRRRHRHRRRHLARRRQGRKLDGPDGRPLRHPPDHPLSDRPPEHPDRRDGRLPAVEQPRRRRPHL